MTRVRPDTITDMITTKGTTMTTTREPIIVECADCGEPSAIHLMHHYWNESVCLVCKQERDAQ